MLNAEGHVTEGATSNVFIVTAGKVRTSPLTSGLLGGITRRAVLRLCAEQGIPCAEEALSPEDLAAADEVFISSSLKQVMPISRLDGKPVAGGHPGPLTLRLLAAYRAAVRAETGVEPESE